MRRADRVVAPVRADRDPRRAERDRDGSAFDREREPNGNVHDRTWDGNVRRHGPAQHVPRQQPSSRRVGARLSHELARESRARSDGCPAAARARASASSSGGAPARGATAAPAAARASTSSRSGRRGERRSTCGTRANRRHDTAEPRTFHGCAAAIHARKQPAESRSRAAAESRRTARRSGVVTRRESGPSLFGLPWWVDPCRAHAERRVPREVREEASDLRTARARVAAIDASRRASSPRGRPCRAVRARSPRRRFSPAYSALRSVR